jgi:hypothetical protein
MDEITGTAEKKGACDIIMDSIKLDEKKGMKLQRLDKLLTGGTGFIMDGAGEKTERQTPFNLSSLLSQAIAIASKENNLSYDAIDLAVTSLGEMVDHPQIKLYMDGINGIKGVEILATAILVQLTSILSATLPFDGAIGDIVPITSGNGRAKLAVYNLSTVISKGMGDLKDKEIVGTVNSLGVFGDSTRSEKFVVDATPVYTFNLKAKKTDATNFKMERGVNEVVITGIDFNFNDYDSQNNAVNAVATQQYEDANGDTIKVEFKYQSGEVVVTFDNTANYLDEIVAVSAGLDTTTLDDITGEVKTDISVEFYVSRVQREKTTVNLLSMRELLSAPNINLMSENLRGVAMMFAQGQKGRKIDNALRFSKKSTKVADLDIGAIGGLSQYSEAVKSFLVAVGNVKSEILADSGLTNKACLVGGSALESIFLRLATHDTNIVVSKNTNENSIRELGRLGDGSRLFIDPRYDTRNPKVGGFSRVDVVGTPNEVSAKPSQSSIDLPIVPIEVGVDVNSDQTVVFEGKLMSESNKNLNSQKLTKYFLFKE